MEGWIIAYLASIIVVPTIIGLLTVDSRNKIILEEGPECLAFAALLVIWPITFSVKLIMLARQAYKDAVESNASEMIGKHHIRKDRPIDREYIVGVPESDLRYLLKISRKKIWDIGNANVMVIREELMNRNAEKELMS